jgi:predicted MFS family arabinose efflux permease
MALGAFLSGWVVDTTGAQSGFWVSVAAGVAAVVTVALGQASLGGTPRPAHGARLPQLAE